jgi:hypothetical protein
MCVSECPHFTFKTGVCLLPEEPGETAPALMDVEDELHPTLLAAPAASSPQANISAEGSDGSDENMDGSEVDIEEEVEEEEDEQQEQQQQCYYLSSSLS